MLTQNHVSVINGFMGQTTGYNKNFIKKHILIMGEDAVNNQAKYIHGNAGKGTFTFLGGHDPEDYKHFVEKSTIGPVVHVDTSSDSPEQTLEKVTNLIIPHLTKDDFEK